MNLGTVPAKEDEPTSKSWRSRKNWIGAIVLGSLVLISLFIANLPYQYVEVSHDSHGVFEFAGVVGERFTTPPRMAGWPFRYWVQYTNDDIPVDHYWSLGHLCLNAIITISVALLVCLFVRWRQRRTEMPGVSTIWFDTGIAFAILAVPGGIVANDYRTWRKHQTLVHRLANEGNVRVSCWLPGVIADQVPESWRKYKSRIRHPLLRRPDDQLVKSVANLPTLKGMHIYGRDFNTSDLQPITKNPHFLTLAIGSRKLTDSDLELIGSLPWLTQLQLSRTNLNATMLRKLDHMSGLRLVDLRHTPLDISKIGKPNWASTVEQLNVSRPDIKLDRQVNIDGWPKLRRCSIRSFSTELNDETLKLRFANLASLETIVLNRVQKHELTLHNVPRLSTIAEDDSVLDQFLDSGRWVPGLTWLSKLNIQGAQSLRTIGMYAKELEDFSIQDSQGLRTLQLGAFSLSHFGTRKPEEANDGKCREWIETLSKMDGPSEIDLSSLPLGNVDLRQLASNRGIRELNLNSTGITPEQVRQLEGMTQLEKLDLSTCELENDQLSWVIKHFPNLTTLRFRGSKIRRIDIAGDSRLRTLNTSRIDQVEWVRVVDQPLLTTYLRLSDTPKHLEIRNGNSIRGLAIENQWPENAVIQGLRKLTWFAAGGAAVDGEVLKQLEACKELDQLTLAYASLSPKDLLSIKRFGSLSMLILPGAELSDEITLHWTNLKSLWEVNFDDTNISVGTLGWLTTIGSLRRLSINHVPLEDNQETEQILSELAQLSELHFAGVPVSPIRLKGLLDCGNLEFLDVSQTEINEQAIQMLCEASCLKLLILHDCDIDRDAFDQLLEANPELVIDAGSNPASDLADAEHADRILFGPNSMQSSPWNTLSNQPNWELRKQLSSRLNSKAYELIARPYENGKIAHQVFRPRKQQMN